MRYLTSLFSISWFIVIFFIVARYNRHIKTIQKKNIGKGDKRSPVVEQYYKEHPDKDFKNNQNIPINYKSNIQQLKTEYESSNDWLNNQMKEERIKKIMISDMFALKNEHQEDCDAHRIRLEHIKKHGME